MLIIFLFILHLLLVAEQGSALIRKLAPFQTPKIQLRVHT